MAANEELDKINERLIRVEVKQESQERRLEETLDLVRKQIDKEDYRYRDLLNKFDAVAKQVSQFKWTVLGVSGTITVLWIAGADILKIITGAG